MATISLFAPDVFAIIVSLTVLSLAGALGRSLLVLRPSRQVQPSDGRTGSTRLPTQAT
jgi:hypothetical protein